MEIPLPAANCLSRRTARRDELVQKSAGSVGQGFDPDRNQITSANFEKLASVENQSRSVLSFDCQHFLSSDHRSFISSFACHDRTVQPGLVSDAVYRFASLAGLDGFRFDFLSDFAKRTVSGLEGPAEVFTIFDVCWDRAVGQQFKGCHGSAPRYQEHFQTDAQISHREQKRSLGHKEVSAPHGRHASVRIESWSLLWFGRVVRFREPKLSDYSFL